MTLINNDWFFYKKLKLKTILCFKVLNFVSQKTFSTTKKMALRNDWDDLMGDVEWEESEIDSGYFNSDNEAGNPGSS